MCNLYNVTTAQQAIRDATRAMVDTLGNIQPIAPGSQIDYRCLG